MSRLRIAEIFSSIQGEGMWLGVPSTFIRLSGCSLRCVWCDTPYASWEPEGPVMSLPEIAAAAELPYAVVTGGEPMIFRPTAELCALLKAQGRTITIETAGIEFQELACDLMSISPKLSNSSIGLPEPAKSRHERLRLNREPLLQLAERYQCQWKFVVNPDESLEEQLDEIAAVLAPLPQSDLVFLMAEGTDRDTLARRSAALVPAAVERGWRVTPRWHIELFGDTRGT